jgi:hypothetical protein
MSGSLASAYAVATPATITTLSSTQTFPVLSANVARRYALFINDSDTTMYLGIGATAALNTGIRLNANGGSYEMAAGHGNIYTGALTVVCASSGKNLIAIEGN